MKAAVVGAGVSGLVAAYVLSRAGARVVLYEKENYLGGHARTVTVDGTPLDLGFMVFNRVTYPNMMEFFETLGVDMELSDMSFSVSLDEGRGCEWGSRNGLSSLFAQMKNALNPYFWHMIREIVKFKDDVLKYLEELEHNPDINRNQTLGDFIKHRGYSEFFQKAYLVPICASIWSCPVEGVLSFSAFSVLSFCRNHHLLQLFGRPQWLTVKRRSHCYVTKVREELENKGGQIRTDCEVISVLTADNGCTLFSGDGSQETFDGCIMAVHAPEALKILGNKATFDEIRVLGAFQYAYSMECLEFSWNNRQQSVCDILAQCASDHTLLKWSTSHPVPSVAASKASLEIDHIQGKRGIWFCGAYQGWDDYRTLGKVCVVLNNPKHMAPSLLEKGARLFVTRFLRQYISAGCLILLEEGGTVYTFERSQDKCLLKSALRIHSVLLQEIATQGDLGLADAYINGDFSLVDKDEGLQNLLMIFIANRDLDASDKRGWWKPLLFTDGIASARYFFQHVSRQNTVRRNISRNYDLSNELFALFLDETMTFSCAVFETEGEDLKVAQMKKISLVIDKKHEVLDMGCGWGSLAIELVKQTGCKCTGITPSEEQVKYAEMKAKEARVQDKIRFLVCDHCQLPDSHKYDRIISCEMLEGVGHEHMEEFFGFCESILAEDGLLVMQFITVPDERYDEYRRSSDFVREYIFPGECLPSLGGVTKSMAAASKLRVEHLENMGMHYYQTKIRWRKNFQENQSKILELGYDEKFMRTLEYYFDCSAADFKTGNLGNHQMVCSHSGNVAVSSDPH